MKHVRLAAGLLVGAGLLLGVLWWSSGEPDSTPSSSTPTSSEYEANRRGTSADIRGRVVDASDETILDATVTLEGSNRTISTDGTFTFSGLDAGTYRIDVQADGYVSPGPEALRQIEVDLPPPSTRDGPVELQPTLYEPARVSGRVVASGDALESAGITLYYKYADGFTGPLDPFSLERVTTTDSNGRFDLELAPGRLHVVAEPAGHPSRQSRELYLESGQHHEGLVIDVAPNGVLTGRVTGTGGSPLRARLLARASDSRRIERRTRADDTGRYRLGRLPTGTYDVVVRASGHRTKVLEAVEITGEGATEKNTTLAEASGVFGRVVGPDGEGVSEVVVRISGTGSAYRWLRTRRGGTFEWANAPEGEGPWRLRAYSPHYASSPEVRSSRDESATLTLGDGGYVEGKVVDGSGQPVSSYTLGVATFETSGTRPYGRRAFEQKTVRQADGTFRYGPLRPGRYRLRVRADGYASASSNAVVVEAEQTAGPVTIELGEGGTIRGVVRSKAKGEPVAGATVVFDPMASPFRGQRATTDAEGRYELTRIPPGRQGLRISHDGYLTRIVSGLQVPEGGTVQRDVSIEKKEKGEDFSFQGIGAVLRKSEGGVQVQNLIEGGGAAESGLKEGDLIEAVDRESVQTWPLSKVVKTIRGRKGDPVTLRVRRDGRRFNVTIQRGQVVVDE